MPLLTPVVRSRSGCWMATLDPHLLVLAWIHPSVRPVLAAVYRWRRRSHGSVGLGILLAVPLVLANLVHPSLVGLVVDGRNSWVAPIRLVALSTLSSLDTVAQSERVRCSIDTWVGINPVECGVGAPPLVLPQIRKAFTPSLGGLVALQPFGCGLIGPKVKELTMPGGVFFGLHLLGCDLDAASSLWWLPRIDYRNQGDTLGLHRLGMHLLPHFEVHAGGTECLTARTSSPLPPLLGWLGWRPFTLHLFWCGRRLFGTHMPVGARAHQSSRVAHAPVSMVACWSGGCCSRPTSGCRSSPHRRGMLIHRPQTPRSGGWVGMVLDQPRPPVLGACTRPFTRVVPPFVPAFSMIFGAWIESSLWPPSLCHAGRT